MNNKIQLERIQVYNLFNRFTYDINLDNGYDVAVFIAPNGCGKTTVFNLVNYIFNPSAVNGYQINSIPFDKITCTLSNGKRVSLERRDGEMSEQISNFDSQSDDVKKLKELKELVVTIYENEFDKIEAFTLSDEFSHIPRESYGDDFSDAYTDRIIERLIEEGINPEEIPIRRARNRTRYTRPHNKFILHEYYKSLKKYNCDLKINFITADRLHKSIPYIKGSDFDYYGRSQGYDEKGKNDPLVTIQKNLKDLYSTTDEKYNRLVSEARDKLPKMYLSKSKEDVPAFKEFEKGWKEYVDDIDKFTKIGMMESSQQILKMGELEKAYNEKGAFLSVYLDVFKDTLNPWREQYDRMKLFVDILNRRNQVTMKSFQYSSSGLKLTVDGDDLKLECLSSGEKNDLIMFYNLIFSSEKGGLVLIDEPEISLHIAWQEEYLDCLLEICKMNGLQAIVATHSPNIVNGHFELYAERELTDERRGN